jgi:hypothetical protein
MGVSRTGGAALAVLTAPLRRVRASSIWTCVNTKMHPANPSTIKNVWQCMKYLILGMCGPPGRTMGIHLCGLVGHSILGVWLRRYFVRHVSTCDLQRFAVHQRQPHSGQNNQFCPGFVCMVRPQVRADRHVCQLTGTLRAARPFSCCSSSSSSSRERVHHGSLVVVLRGTFVEVGGCTGVELMLTDAAQGVYG